MSEDIKEILDNLIRYKGNAELNKWQPEDILTIEDVWLLLDYITNLQQENERLNNIIKEVREYIEKEQEKDYVICDYDIELTSKDLYNDILEILDKENK